MKKKMFFAAVIVTAMLLSGCADTRGGETNGPPAGDVVFSQDVMSYDEMMRLPTVRTSACDRMLYEGLEKHIEDDLVGRGRQAAFATGECFMYKHYIGFDENGNLRGYTVSEVTITQIVENYNGLPLSVGDTVSVRQDYYIRPADEVRAAAIIFDGIFMRKIANMWSDADGVEMMFEVTPRPDTDYEKCIGWNEVPMAPGEEYSFEIYESPRGDGKYVCLFIYPTSEDSLLIKNDWYDLHIDEDIMEVAEEIFELVTDHRRGGE